MYPYDEKTLRNEVIYLHSLWHQGPPSDPNSNSNPNLNNPNPSPSSSRIPYVPNPTPFYYRSYYPLCHQQTPNPNPTPYYPLCHQQTPNPNPSSYYPLCHQQMPNPNHRSNYPLYHPQTTISNSRPKPCTRNSLKPTNPTYFKKENTSTTTTRKKRLREKKVKKKKKKNKMSQPDPPPDLGPEWPCPEPLEPALEASGWPALKPVSTPKDQPLSANEHAYFAAIQLQYKAAEVCRKFFTKRVDFNANEDEDEDDNGDDEDDEMMEEGSDENEESRFFLLMFVEDSELRSYFEKNYETGDFCCLVCQGIGKKAWKRYKGCVGLVQHSFAISKTKRKRAHRAFGQVVCKVLGWDFDRFPTIVLKDEPLSRSLAKSVELQGDPEGNNDDNKDDSSVIKENVVSANDGSGENAVSINGSSENAASVDENNGENAVYVNASIGEHVVSVSGDNGDDKEV
ncbi:uncharacterized protein LOC132161590 [Corylus avellana]|uniref:uncharacterized protein LOC132161590 n=1 Tax=Corylus avellana TaxID=13451 RepID=UPI00286C4A9C|nr:uncharacterized protein LOC132161590 [Corylus avellana]XP_059427738.1 uncharacterized protein LOC132161590 [Corylus avellana]XP_059427746.1 uncharacterized protein LOC132161590 [Corylus avellana]XP_059427753.1 uncharacterized protein LOC132161590 [Corylus avellana]